MGNQWTGQVILLEGILVPTLYEASAVFPLIDVVYISFLFAFSLFVCLHPHIPFL